MLGKAYHHNHRLLLRLDANKLVAGGGVAENITEGTGIGFIAGNERNLRHRMVEQLLRADRILDFDALKANLQMDTSFVTTHRFLNDLFEKEK